MKTMGRDERDPYSVLGLGREASASDISRAYRRAARETHPDSHPGDPSAAQRFNAVSDAYDTLRDPARRAAYDRAHPVVRRVAPTVRVGPSRLTVRVSPARPSGGRRGPVWGGSFDVVLGRRRPGEPRTRIEDELAEVRDLFSRLFRAFR
jgi:curved DNA-binding protein CbpA